MPKQDLLNYIWSGGVKCRSRGEETPLAVLLECILSVPTVSLVMTTGMKEPMAFSDSEELLPGCQLGDVLLEEVGIDIPVNSVILFEPHCEGAGEQVSASELGRQLGVILSSIAGRPSAQYTEMQSGAAFLDLDPCRLSRNKLAAPS